MTKYNTYRGNGNPADALTRRHQYSAQRTSDAVKEEDSKLVKFLKVPENASDEEIQAAIDQVLIVQSITVQFPA